MIDEFSIAQRSIIDLLFDRFDLRQKKSNQDGSNNNIRRL